MDSPSSTPPPPPPRRAPPLPLRAPPQSHSPSPSSSPEPEFRFMFVPGPECKPKTRPKRKPAPLPWTHPETLALIQAYQQKWYSLERGQLRKSHWDEVAATVAGQCGFDELNKTSTQCRHKIEKLRKRYRSELQKPYPYSWQYFEHMDQMERGYARTIAAVNTPSYNDIYSGSADFSNNNNSRSDGGDSDESDGEWNAEGVKKNKSKSINNIVRGGRRANRAAIEGVFGDGVARVLRNQMMNGKRKKYYGSDDDVAEEEEGEEEVQVEEEDGKDYGIGGTELAAEIRGFTEGFMRMESKKIEMMRETEGYRMEMEKRRMEMILEAQRKIVDTIGNAFGDHKRAKVAQES